MTERKLLIHGDVVTMNARFECIEDGAVLIKGKRIEAVGKTSDLLALVGANQSVLNLSNELVTRELRNKVNRQVNCINANINKTVEASLKQVEAINTIISTVGLESLPEDLQEVAVLRLANPEESLEELLKLSTIKLTRSGLNHRFRKILKIAKELEE